MSRPGFRLLSGRWRALGLAQQPVRRPNHACWYSTRYSQPGSRQSARLVADDIDHGSASPSIAAQGQHGSDPYIKSPEEEFEQKRQYTIKRMRYLSYGLFVSVLVTGGAAFKLIKEMEEEDSRRQNVQCDATADDNAKFQGRPVHVIGAGEDKRIITEDEAQVELVETGTSSVPYFPRAIYLPSSPADAQPTAPARPNTAVNPGNIQNHEEYTLIGLGIRSVSIFSIQVYVLGLYVRTADLSTLQARLIHYVNQEASTLVPSEKDTLRSAMLDPVHSAEIWQQLLASGIKTAWRISPTRNTDFAHLRDGWITGIKRGTQAASAAAAASALGPASTEYESESFGEAVKSFKDMFNGWGKTAKGSVVTLLRDQRGALQVIFEDPAKQQPAARAEVIGTVADARIAKLIWLGYTAGKNVSSEEARKGVADGCLVLASRPVGSAETMVN